MKEILSRTINAVGRCASVGRGAAAAAGWSACQANSTRNKTPFDGLWRWWRGRDRGEPPASRSSAAAAPVHCRHRGFIRILSIFIVIVYV